MNVWIVILQYYSLDLLMDNQRNFPKFAMFIRNLNV